MSRQNGTETFVSAVCVLGMHRCGTSAVARLVRELGVELGPPEHLMGPAEDNPGGFWEHQGIRAINDEILRRYGGSWEKPPRFPERWQDAAELGDLRQQARALLEAEFGRARLWGWKDPRTCLTLPFWQQLVPQLRYVICLRNPLDVARSLQKRNGFALGKGVDLWLAYVNGALQHTGGKPRLLLFYEDLMSDGQQETRRLARFLGNNDCLKRQKLPRLVSELLDPALQHHRSSVVEAVDEPQVSFAARALYLTLRLHARQQSGQASGDEPPGEMLERALLRFSIWARRTDEDFSAVAARLAESEQLRGQLRDELAQCQAALAGSRAELQAEQQRADRLEKSLELRESTILNLRAEHERALQALRSELAEREARITALTGQLDRQRAAAVAARCQVQHLQEQLDAARSELQRAAEMRQQLRALQQQLQELQAAMLWPKLHAVLTAPLFALRALYRLLRLLVRLRLPREARFRRVLVIGSGAKQAVVAVTEHLLQRWPHAEFTALVPSSHRNELDSAPPGLTVRECEQPGSFMAALRRAAGLWREKFDLAVLLMDGTPGMSGYKALGFFAGARYLLAYNERMDSFYWMLGQCSKAARHLRWRIGLNARRANRMRPARAVGRMLGWCACVGRCVPVLLRAALRRPSRSPRENTA